MFSEFYLSTSYQFTLNKLIGWRGSALNYAFNLKQKILHTNDLMTRFDSGVQLENIPWLGKNIFRVGHTFGDKNILNIISNNSENFRGARLLPGPRGASSPPPLVAGLI